MPRTTAKKRTAQIVPKKSTKKHAAIVKKVPPTALITGGTGFLGAHLVRQLVESGAKDIRVMATSIPEWLAGLGVDTLRGLGHNRRRRGPRRRRRLRDLPPGWKSIP